MTVPLSTLRPGDRFALSTGKTGKLLRLGDSAAVVRYDEAREITIQGRTFTTHGDPTTISLGTDVQPLEEAAYR